MYRSSPFRSNLNTGYITLGHSTCVVKTWIPRGRKYVVSKNNNKKKDTIENDQKNKKLDENQNTETAATATATTTTTTNNNNNNNNKKLPSTTSTPYTSSTSGVGVSFSIKHQAIKMVKFQKKAGLAEEASWPTRSGGFGGRKLRSYKPKKNPRATRV